MNSQQWKNVLDHLDEDIVDSAAEHLSSDDADEDSTEYHPDSKPREYRNISRRTRHGGLFIGMGTVAAAAAITGVIIVNNSGSIQQPMLSTGAALKSASVEAADSLVIEDSGELTSSFMISSDISAIPTGFSAAELSLFEDFFYGTWTDTDTTIDLCYSANSAFSDDYICTGIEQTDGGCYMGALSSVDQYDLWYVRPADNSGMMYIFRNVSLSDGVIQYNADGTISCERMEKFQLSSASPNEYNVLGYFGKVKLADDIGMTPDALYNKVELDTYAGSSAGAAHWTRRSGGYTSPWDKVVLREQTEDSVVMSMSFTQSEDDSRTVYFDMYWFLTDAGYWDLQNVQKSRDVFALTADDLRVTLRQSDLDIFEQYFAWIWTSDMEELALNYSQDIFSVSNVCGGFYADEDGWYMYQLMGSAAEPYIQVYYIPYDDPFTMYLYEPDNFGYAMQDNYLAVYTHTDSGLDEPVTWHMSWLGLQRWILDKAGSSDENSLADAIYSALTVIWNDSMSADNYDGSGDSFEGYVMEELSSVKYRLMFQVFDQDNNSQWVSVVIRFADGAWELLPADGIAAETVG